jgi:hypothetical protein
MEANKNFAKWLSCGIQISGTFGLHHVLAQQLPQFQATIHHLINQYRNKEPYDLTLIWLALKEL